MRIILFILLVALPGAGKLLAQDIHFSQPTMLSTFSNPAMAGASHRMQAVTGYRSQWNSVASPYKTFAFSYDMQLGEKKEKKGHWAAGIGFFTDKAGTSQMGTAQGNLLIGYHVKLGAHSTIGGGLMGGFAQRKISYADLTWGSQFNGSAYDPSLSSGENTGADRFTYADLGGGLAWTYKKGERYMTGNDHTEINAGAAVFHPHRPEYSFAGGNSERLYPRLTVHSNALVGIRNTNVSVAPGIMYSRQGNSFELLAGSMVRYMLRSESRYTGLLKSASVSAGLFYRMRDAYVISSLLEFSDYALGISYDVNVSGLIPASNARGGIELILRYIPSKAVLLE
jgi:type IX secretion system PorP/SprF family membrane protein